MEDQLRVQKIELRRAHQNSTVNKSKSASYRYNVTINSKQTQVCKKAFVSLFRISERQVRRLQTVLLEGWSPRDMRGVGNKNRALPQQTVKAVHDHIASFPVHTSHYSSGNHIYLDARLNVQKMFDLYKAKYPDTKVNYKYYVKYFNDNFNLTFGQPQIDTCVTCESLMVKIRSHMLNDEAKQNLPPSPNFQSKMSSTCDKVGEYILYNQYENECYFYVYNEGTARKGANEVCSFIDDYIKHHVPAKVKDLRLFGWLDSALKEHMNEATLFTGTSKGIQNVLLQWMLEVYHEKVKEEIGKADYVSVIADETTDVSSLTQMCGLVDKASAHRAENPGSNPGARENFSPFHYSFTVGRDSFDTINENPPSQKKRKVETSDTRKVAVKEICYMVITQSVDQFKFTRHLTASKFFVTENFNKYNKEFPEKLLKTKPTKSIRSLMCLDSEQS
ncbi:hypothetical protein ANN_00628 [Periplaneta americana]|uniref:DUF4371 domain-containing protein n=1 Tax=Periplaneta americana TaxID=6978 RepID=A0ABQ8TRB6_PERAM|nr:hypothetical protein ANN_00628 [Periplaneta americana]